jgi:hypothetical protein
LAAARGEMQQAADASWLVRTLMPRMKPAHVFYYYFRDAQRRAPGCDANDSDSALYVPSNDANTPDAPRPAANIVFSGSAVPSAYTGTPAGGSAQDVTLTGSIYPGGLLDAKYHIEYGTSNGYESYSDERDAGSGLGLADVKVNLAGLAPGTTYHYRLVAWNSEGAEGPSYGGERTFTTPEHQLVSEI